MYIPGLYLCVLSNKDSYNQIHTCVCVLHAVTLSCDTAPHVKTDYEELNVEETYCIDNGLLLIAFDMKCM